MNPTLDTVVRAIWTDDLLGAHVAHTRLAEWPGPPWIISGPCGERIRYARVNSCAEIPSHHIEPFIRAIELEFRSALHELRGIRVSTSEALVAGERRRSPG